jgi:hypothetical protein
MINISHQLLVFQTFVLFINFAEFYGDFNNIFYAKAASLIQTFSIFSTKTHWHSTTDVVLFFFVPLKPEITNFPVGIHF